MEVSLCRVQDEMRSLEGVGNGTIPFLAGPNLSATRFVCVVLAEHASHPPPCFSRSGRGHWLDACGGNGGERTMLYRVYNIDTALFPFLGHPPYYPLNLIASCTIRPESFGVHNDAQWLPAISRIGGCFALIVFRASALSFRQTKRQNWILWKWLHCSFFAELPAGGGADVCHLTHKLFRQQFSTLAI